MIIGIDGRRNPGSGIGRVTSNFIGELLKLDRKNHYVIIIRKGTVAKKKEFLEGDNYSIIECDIPFFSKMDLYDLPKIVEKNKVDVFLSPQFYVSPFIQCPQVKIIHDLWPVLHPSWLPTLKEVERGFGKRSIPGIFEIVKKFKSIYQENNLIKKNNFIENKLRSNKTEYTYAASMMTLSLATANQVVAPSNYSKKEISQVYPEYVEKIKVIENFASPIFSHVTNIERQFNLLHVSKWEPRKNIEMLIKSVELARKKLNKDLKLTLVGDVGYRDYGNKILHIISKPKYRKYISHKGIISDNELVHAYQSSLAFIFPSLHEGFGIPPLEAMASGTPVITSNLTALPEVVGNAGILVDPTSVNELSNNIVRIASDETLRKDMSRKGLKKAAEFDPKRLTKEFLSIIRKTAFSDPLTLS